MTTTLIAYACALIVFVIIDLAWITTVAEPMYRKALQDALLPGVRIAPAIAFYLLYPAGLVTFAVAPALKSGGAGTAALHGALFGLFTYATYDLTNFATLRNWTFEITIIDIAYGAALGSVVSVVSYWVASRWIR